MYIFPDMIDMGLKEGQGWPSAAHVAVAQAVCLCNPLVNTRDTLTEMVQKIIKVPVSEIKRVTFEGLAKKYGVPCIRYR